MTTMTTRTTRCSAIGRPDSRPLPDYPHPMHKAVFFDRDDTLIHCRDATPDGDLGDPALVRLLPTVGRAIQTLNNSGLVLIVISNQGGVARGRYSIADVDLVNAEVNRQLEGAIRGFYFCPFHPEGSVPEFTREHPNRKPSPGMLREAAEDFDINLSQSWVIGDSARDCVAGRAVGARTILVPRAELYTPEEADSAAADFVSRTLLEAIGIVLTNPGAGA